MRSHTAPNPTAQPAQVPRLSTHAAAIRWAISERRHGDDRDGRLLYAAGAALDGHLAGGPASPARVVGARAMRRTWADAQGAGLPDLRRGALRVQLLRSTLDIARDLAGSRQHAGGPQPRDVPVRDA